MTKIQYSTTILIVVVLSSVVRSKTSVSLDIDWQHQKGTFAQSFFCSLLNNTYSYLNSTSNHRKILSTAEFLAAS